MKSSILLFAVIASLTLSSCGGIIRSYIRKDDGNTPAEFGRQKTTILVIKHRKSYNKRLEEAFVKRYKGEYVLIENSEIANYPDTEKYQYIFDNTIDVIRDNTPGARIGSKTPTHGSMSFFIKDRKNNKTYPTEISSGAYTSVLNAYVNKLETVRTKNSSQN